MEKENKMAHNLNINENGEANMAYVGETPWHKQGVYLGEKEATSEEMLVAAGMDWKVITRPVYVPDNEEEYYSEIEGYKSIIRQDTNEILSIVKNRYTPLQNEEAFAVLDPFLSETKAVWHTAGVLGKGERVWVLAKLPGNIQVTKDDIIDKYFLLTSSHDGSSSIQLRFTPIRVVCQNTLQMSLVGEGSSIMKVKHTKNQGGKIKEAIKILGLVEQCSKEFENTAKEMYEFKMSDTDIDNYLTEILNIGEDCKEKVQLYNDKSFSRFRNLVENGVGTDIKDVKGSLWGVYNAVTEGVDHTDRKVKDTLKYIWFGAGNNIKDKAWHSAKKLLKGV